MRRLDPNDSNHPDAQKVAITVQFRRLVPYGPGNLTDSVNVLYELVCYDPSGETCMAKTSLSHIHTHKKSELT